MTQKVTLVTTVARARKHLDAMRLVLAAGGADGLWCQRAPVLLSVESSAKPCIMGGAMVLS